MKKQTLIIIILCVLVAAVIALRVAGIIEPREGEPGSFVGQVKEVPNVPSDGTKPNTGTTWDYSVPTCSE